MTSSERLQREASPPRARILAAAGELFYKHGIRAVGVDAIAEAAGTNKMTLYRHFESKDLLVAEYLREQAAGQEAIWDALRGQHPGDPRAQLSAWIQRAADPEMLHNDRGCALSNAAIELTDPDHPALRVVADLKRSTREHLIALCTEANLNEPERLADEIFLLVEGAHVSLQSMGLDGPGTRLLALAENLVERAAQG